MSKQRALLKKIDPRSWSGVSSPPLGFQTWKTWIKTHSSLSLSCYLGREPNMKFSSECEAEGVNRLLTRGAWYEEYSRTLFCFIWKFNIHLEERGRRKAFFNVQVMGNLFTNHQLWKCISVIEYNYGALNVKRSGFMRTLRGNREQLVYGLICAPVLTLGFFSTNSSHWVW